MRTINLFIIAFCIFLSQPSLAKKGARTSEIPHKEELLSRENGISSQKPVLNKFIQTHLMKDIVAKEIHISETQVMSFLKESSKGDKNIQEFFSFLIKEGNRSDLKNIKSLFVNWLVLNNTGFSRFESISSKQLSVLVKELSQKEILELNSVLELANNMMKVDTNLTPDMAYHKAMVEKGVNAEKLKRCQR